MDLYRHDPPTTRLVTPGITPCCSSRRQIRTAERRRYPGTRTEGTIVRRTAYSAARRLTIIDFFAMPLTLLSSTRKDAIMRRSARPSVGLGRGVWRYQPSDTVNLVVVDLREDDLLRTPRL